MKRRSFLKLGAMATVATVLPAAIIPETPPRLLVPPAQPNMAMRGLPYIINYPTWFGTPMRAFSEACPERADIFDRNTVVFVNMKSFSA